MQNQNKSNLHVFLLYINIIILCSFSEFAIIKRECSVVATILKITQDALEVVVQTLYFNVSFLYIKYTNLICENAHKPGYSFLADQIILIWY